VARDLRRLLTVIEGKGRASPSRSRHVETDLTDLKRELERISSKLRSASSEGDDGNSVRSDDQPNLADKSK
jgi:hypothetical protein